MNPYLIIACLVAILGAGAGGFKLGVDHMKAEELDRKELLEAVADEAANTAARAIAQLKPTYTTIQGKLEKQIETNTVFRDCRLDAVSLQLVNQALSGGTAPTGDSKLPQLTPLADDSFGATTSKLVEVSGIYYQCRAAAGVK